MVFPEPPIRPLNGARRRTSDGRSKSPDEDRLHLSCGAIGCSSLPRSRWVSRARLRTSPGARSSHGTSTSSGSWRSTGARGEWSGSGPPRQEQPRAPSTKDGTWASSSAITDGRRVFAFFDSSGLYAYDMQGTQLWEKRFGDKKIFAEVGESGSTPVLYGDRLVVVWDHQGASFIVALNASTGQELWRTERQDVDSWGTPLVVEHDGRAQVVTTGDKQVRSYDLETGRLVWENDGLNMNPIPSPVAEDGLVFVTAGFRSSRLHAIRLADAQGNIAGSRAIVWSLDRDTPYVSSPLLYDGVLYFLKSNAGILSAFDARSGRPHYQAQRLTGLPEVYSSPVGAQGRVYITSRDGVTLVIRHGPRFEVLATNTLDDGFDASPALVDNELYLRGNRYLYSISAR